MPTIKLFKIPGGIKRMAAHKVANKSALAPNDFVLTIGADGSVTVFGTDGTMQPDGTTPTLIDISALATMTGVSSDTSKVTVSVTGMTAVETPVAVGTDIGITFTVTITATNKVLTAVDTVDVAPAPPGSNITGLVITHNQPAIS